VKVNGANESHMPIWIAWSLSIRRAGYSARVGIVEPGVKPEPGEIPAHAYGRDWETAGWRRLHELLRAVASAGDWELD